MKKYTEEEALGAIKWIIENSGNPVAEARELISTIFNEQPKPKTDFYTKHQEFFSRENMMKRMGNMLATESAKNLTSKQMSQIPIPANKRILKTYLDNIGKSVSESKKPLIDLKLPRDKAILTSILKDVKEKKL